jgi:hypothetical protein
MRRALFATLTLTLTLTPSFALAKEDSVIARLEPKKVAHAPATATLVPLSENWRMDGDIPVHALLISLQGLANRDQPRLYLEYPTHWQWEIVRPLEAFLEIAPRREVAAASA